jgi:hypothetical protein
VHQFFKDADNAFKTLSFILKHLNTWLSFQHDLSARIPGSSASEGRLPDRPGNAGIPSVQLRQRASSSSYFGLDDFHNEIHPCA